MKKLLKILTVILVGGVSMYMVLAIWVGRNVHRDDKAPSDVIMVLGAKSFKQGVYNPCLVERVRHGVEILQQGFAEKLLFSGGTDREDGRNEAETMREIALTMGVPSSKILLEKTSTSTYENFVNSKRLMDALNLRTAVVVTDPFHTLRAKLVAHKIGIQATASPAIQSPCWQQWKYASYFFWKEPLAIVYYKIKGKI